MKIFGKGKRFHETKILTLVNRPRLTNKNKYEFLNRMSEREQDQYFLEVQNIVKSEGIKPKNINQYNKYFNFLIQEREEIFQSIKNY